MTGLAVRVDLTGHLDRGEPVEQLTENDPGLDTGQRRPQAEVRSEPEAQVGVGMAVDAELVGVGPEHRLVTVGRGVDQQQGIALGDGLAPHHGGDGWPCA